MPFLPASPCILYFICCCCCCGCWRIVASSCCSYCWCCCCNCSYCCCCSLHIVLVVVAAVDCFRWPSWLQKVKWNLLSLIIEIGQLLGRNAGFRGGTLWTIYHVALSQSRSRTFLCVCSCSLLLLLLLLPFPSFTCKKCTLGRSVKETLQSITNYFYIIISHSKGLSQYVFD